MAHAFAIVGLPVHGMEPTSTRRLTEPSLIGKTLAHYEITEKIGQGGMGEVYRARDTKLDRDVALKLLPSELSGDPERVARFEREATTLASLQHANIASIYGFEQDQGRRFLIMELVEGEELAERLTRGPIPVDEAIDLALQITEGLEAAHAQGIVHRDLKPANIKLTPTRDLKILDFGLARAYAGDVGDGSETEIANSPTITAAMTQDGVILGTAAYMSPEQARGRPIDKQTDVWSFGVVLYEMLTGDRLFDGETISDSIGAILHREPELERLPAVPAQIHTLLRRCLAREKKQRLHDIGDARIALEDAKRAPTTAAAATASTGLVARTLPWLVAVGAMVALFATMFTGRRSDGDAPVLRFSLTFPEGRLFDEALPHMALSPDGSRLAYVGRSDSGELIFVRDLDHGSDRALEATTGAETPFFSPDGEWIAFAQDRKLKKISIMGGPPIALCDAERLRGGDWGPDGTIVFSPDRSAGLLRVSANGGTPDTLTSIESIRASFSDATHRWPQFLPDGDAVIYTSSDNNSIYDEAKIMALALDGGSPRTLVAGGSGARYVPGGFLAFARGSSLFAVRMDPERLETVGSPIPVLEDVEHDGSYGNSHFTFSQTGTLAYKHQTGSASLQRLVWLDRNGQESPASEHVRAYRDPAVSPDETHIAVGIGSIGATDIWILELARDNPTRLTFEDASDLEPQWSPNGEWIYFSSTRDGAPLHIHRKRANGTGQTERITTEGEFHTLHDITHDGSLAVMTGIHAETGLDLSLIHLDESPPRVELFVGTPYQEFDPSFSPDGEWVVYGSNESGQREIYAIPTSGTGARVKISTNGGSIPSWNPAAQEIFYAEEATDQLMSVRYSIAEGRLRPELPVPLFSMREEWSGGSVRPDGSGWLLTRYLEDVSAEVVHPTVVLNWTTELEAKVPRP